MFKYILNPRFLVFCMIIIQFSCSGALPGDNIPAHPRILMLKGEEDEIRKNIKEEKTWEKIHNIIIGESENILEKPPVERIQIGKRLLDKSREALKRIFFLSYSYRMTSNPEYLKRAEKEMLAVAEFSDWNPSHFLDVAEITMGMAIGYDWLYNSLEKSSREKIRDAIINKGIMPSLDPKYNGWLKSTNNWNQVCNAGMTYGAMAIFEDDTSLANKIISRGCESVMLPMNEYEPDGAYPEGYSYWDYGTSFNIMFISAYEKAYQKEFPAAKNTGFLKTGSYLMNMSGLSGSCFNYSDCGSGISLHPAMFWFAGRNGDPSILWEEKKELDNLKRARERLLPAIMIWGSDLKISDISEPVAKFWSGGGKNPVALMRTSRTDPDAIFIGLKCGTPKASHSHLDIGSFVMDADGQRWAMDFGSQDYNSLEQAGVDLWNLGQNSQRWQVYRYNNYVHNTLTINNQLQNVGGYAAITSSSDNPAMMNAVTDLTTLYNPHIKSAFRGVAIVDESYLTVRDEIETGGNKASVRWTMLTPASVEIKGDNSARLSIDGKKLVIKVTEPAGIKITTRAAEPTNAYDQPNPGISIVGFEVTIPPDTKKVIQVLLIPGGNEPDPSTIPGRLEEWPKKNE